MGKPGKPVSFPKFGITKDEDLVCYKTYKHADFANMDDSSSKGGA